MIPVTDDTPNKNIINGNSNLTILKCYFYFYVLTQATFVWRVLIIQSQV